MSEQACTVSSGPFARIDVHLNVVIFDTDYYMFTLE